MSRSIVIISIIAVAVVATAGTAGFILLSGNGNHDITITYELNGGVNDADNLSTLSSDSLILKDPIRQHYTFDGWYSDETLSVKITEVKKSDGDVTVYAKWSPVLYSITYVLGSDDVTNTNPEKFTSADTLTLKDPSRQHYTFEGWYTESTFTNKVSSLNRTGEQTVYAKWTPILYGITYVLGSDDVTNTNPDKFSSDTLTLQDASRPHYTFNGWYTESTFTNKVSSLNRTGEQTVYAKWTPITYSIQYVLNEEQAVHNNPTSGTIEDSLTIHKAIRPDLAFNGWYTTSTFEPNTKIGDHFTPSSNTTLYAKWDDLVGCETGHALFYTGSQDYTYLMITGYCAYEEGHYLTVHYIKNQLPTNHSSYDSYRLQSDWTAGGLEGGTFLRIETIETLFGSIETAVYEKDGETQWIGSNGLAYRAKSSLLTAVLYAVDSFEPDEGQATITVTASEGIASVTGAGTYNIGDTVTLTVTMEGGYEFRGFSADGIDVVATELTFEFVAFESMDFFALASNYYAVYNDDEESTYTSWKIIDDKTGSTVIETDVDKTCFQLDSGKSYTMITTKTIGGQEETEIKDIETSWLFVKMWFWYYIQFNGLSYVGYIPDYTYYKNLNPDMRQNVPYNRVTSFVTYEDEGVIAIRDDILEETEGMTDLQRANYTLSFIQHCIPYATDNQSKGVDEYWKYPYETIYEECGDCEDKSFLFAALMKSMGYDVALFLLPGHMAVGLANIEGASGSGFESDGKMYFYCETTSEGWTVGMIPPEYTQATVFVV